MMQTAFVACSKTKASRPTPAAALYTSPLFRKSLLAALDVAKKVYILSAKHGVLDPGAVVEPYDVTLKSMPQSTRAAWGRAAGRQLDAIVKRRSTAVLLCGEEYIAPLRDDFARLDIRVDEPLAGLSLGQRLQRLATINQEAVLKIVLPRFYRSMRRLWVAQGGGRLLSECTGKQSWPGRGVYFIVEAQPGMSAGRMPRIVRVGTHAVSSGSRTSLWDRVSTHRGTGLGAGSHRSSIFRSHVGRSIINSEPDAPWPITWGAGQSAPRSVRSGEETLERAVSRAIGAMRVIWIDVADGAGPSSDRAYIERNAIGLLSRAGLLSPTISANWLGRYTSEWRIAASGLWNLDHLFGRPDDAFIDVLSTYIDVTLGRSSAPNKSIAPTREPATSRRTQLMLFPKGIEAHEQDDTE